MNLKILGQTLFETIRAGFLNRVKTYRFIIPLVLTIIFCYMLLPSSEALYGTFVLQDSFGIHYRGVYNSAWIGTMMAVLTSFWLSLFSFYIINDAITRDRETKVGEIVAATQVRNSVYLLAKFITNIVILGTMASVVFIMSIVLQFIRGEDYFIDFGALVVPFAILVIPVIFFVSGTALFFETFPLTRRWLMNVIWGFVWVVLITTSMRSSMGKYSLIDVVWIHNSLNAAAQAQYPNISFTAFTLGLHTFSQPAITFLWTGFNWTFEVIMSRLFWYGLALIFAAASLIFFHRFDPSLERRILTKLKTPAVITGVFPTDAGISDEQQAISAISRYKRYFLEIRLFSRQKAKPAVQPRIDTLTPLKSSTGRFGFSSLVMAEIRLMFKSMPKWWSLIAIGLIIVGLFTPVEIAQRFWLSVSILWPLFMWSKMGTHEAVNGTQQLIYSSTNILKRQFPAIWLSGVLVALFPCVGIILNLAMNGYGLNLFSVFIGLLFVPSMALCFGVWTGGNKLFTFVYPLFWYIGTWGDFILFDFIETKSEAVSSGIFLIYVVFTVILLSFALIGRKRQINSL
ncbi:MAG: hypothetical protein ACFFC7_18830 [Candidatus Hermodarchaeota archaeon]